MRTLFFTEQFIREGDTIVAYCPELDVSSCGDTVSQARANLQTALRLFLEEAARIGTLKDILSEAGYDMDDTVMLSPLIDVGRREFVLAEEVARSSADSRFLAGPGPCLRTGWIHDCPSGRRSHGAH